MEVSECMYGRLELSSLLSSSRTMAAAACCGGRRWRAQATARQRAGRKKEEGERGRGRGLARSHINGPSGPRPSQRAASAGDARTGQRGA